MCICYKEIKMGKFTILGNDANKQIEEQMNTISREVKNSLGKNFYSLILIGGFGRGEGSVKLIDGKIYTFNDYDMIVITKTPVQDKILNKISLNALKKINPNSSFSFVNSDYKMNFYIDLRNMTINELKKVEPFIRYYEIKKAGLVVCGKDAIKLIPNYEVKDIPLQDGMRYIFNRICLLIECFRTKYLTGDINQNELETLNFYISKNYLTIAEALLLLSGKFVPSYKKRAEILKETYKKDFKELAEKYPTLPKKVEYFTNFKLNPDKMDKNIINNWFEAREDMLAVAEFYLEKAFKIKVKDLTENPDIFKREMKKKLVQPFLKYYLKNKFNLTLNNEKGMLYLSYLAQIYLNILFFLKLKRLKKTYPKMFLDLTDPGLKIYCAALPLIFSISKKGKENSRKLKKAISYLNKIYPKQKNELNFDETAEYFADAFRIYQFLKI